MVTEFESRGDIPLICGCIGESRVFTLKGQICNDFVERPKQRPAGGTAYDQETVPTSNRRSA